MPKGTERTAAPQSSKPVPAPAQVPPGATSAKNYAHTLSLRLTADQYRRLRRYAARVEDQGHGRVTHQSVIEAALGEYLDREDARAQESS